MTQNNNSVLEYFTLIMRLYFDEQVIEDLRERYFGPTFEFKSHEKVRSLLE